ncbi:hypothetical protein WMY93_029518 [Mugilogobius chulae]|uniref:Thiamine transporter 2 n=1 Tax=Mugilogobius chulae TaxID=88201 RepID=A0AAW0N2D1_9GOBI
MDCWNRLKTSNWAYPTAILCLYGFFGSSRVAEPFLTPYLIGPYKNISEEVVTNYLFPIWTYSYLSFLFPVFLLTDFLKHKPVIVVQGLFLVSNYVLLCFVPGLAAMVFLQVNYAVVTSTEVAYFSYIYSVIPFENYQRATGYLRGAMLVGYTFAASLGQLLVSVAGLDYFYLNAITLGLEIVAFLISLCLPMPKTSLFFKETQVSPTDKDSLRHGGGNQWCSRESVTRAGHLLLKSFKESYSSSKLICWSLWWALATAGYTQIFNYCQLLWNHVEQSAAPSTYNGAVEAVSCLAGAAAAFCVSHVKVTWAVWGELALGLFSAAATGGVFLMALSSNIWACYAGYIIIKSCYMLLITIAVFQIASHLSMECYALTFGINTFVAVLLQTIITSIVVDDTALGLDIVTQFIIYGSYYAVISVLFLIRGMYTACTNQNCSEEKESQVKQQEVQEKKMKLVEQWKSWTSDWRYATSLLCLYGFFSTVKPLEPFLIPFFTGPDKNLTAEQVNNEILPVWTYSYLSVLVPVFLLTDWLRYKPVVFFQSVALFITTALLYWTKTVPLMQATQFFYGMVTACEVAYFSYIYSVIEVKRYKKATSYTRSVQLLGYTVGAVLGQLLVSFDLMSFQNILVFTLVLTAMAMVTSCLLPMPKRSLFFHHKISDAPENISEDTDGGSNGDKEAKEHNSSGRKSLGKVLCLLKKDLVECYSSRTLLCWCIWWALATCGYNQTVNYVQVLWEHIEPAQNSSIYNGGVEAVSYLLSAATAYGVGFTEVAWERWGELALGGFSVLGAASLFLMTFIGNIWVCYAGYVVFKCLYMLLITIAMFQIAAGLSMERYALVFGANTFGALVLQTVLVAVVVDSQGLALSIIPQVSL